MKAYVCKVCGYIHFGEEAPERCPQCGAGKEAFVERQESEGAKIVEVKEDDDKAPMPPLIFTRSNGVASYETTDLAAIYERKINFNRCNGFKNRRRSQKFKKL